MKALEKDRARRYETANGLARDIERYLQDEPVEACPPSAGYRLRKFGRKHSRSLLAAATFAVLLFTGAAGEHLGSLAGQSGRANCRRCPAGRAEQRREAETVLRFVQDQVFAAARPVGRPNGLGPGRDATAGARRRVARRGAKLRYPAARRSPPDARRSECPIGISATTGPPRISFAGREHLQQSTGPDHPDISESMHNLANVVCRSGRRVARLSSFDRKRSCGAIPRWAASTSRRSEASLALARSYRILNRFDLALQARHADGRAHGGHTRSRTTSTHFRP